MTHITLPYFITQVGDHEAAVLFDVKRRTVQSWRLRSRYPRPEQANLIVQVTADHAEGSVSYEGIYAQGSNAT